MGCTLILSCCQKYHMVSLLQFTFLQLFLEYPSMFSFTYPLFRIDLWMLRFVGHAYLDRVVTSMDQGTLVLSQSHDFGLYLRFRFSFVRRPNVGSVVPGPKLWFMEPLWVQRPNVGSRAHILVHGATLGPETKH